MVVERDAVAGLDGQRLQCTRVPVTADTDASHKQDNELPGNSKG